MHILEIKKISSFRMITSCKTIFTNVWYNIICISWKKFDCELSALANNSIHSAVHRLWFRLSVNIFVLELLMDWNWISKPKNIHLRITEWIPDQTNDIQSLIFCRQECRVPIPYVTLHWNVECYMEFSVLSRNNRVVPY